MSSFIVLTAAVPDDKVREVLVNVDKIVSVQDGGRYRTIFLERGEEYVKETMEDLQMLLPIRKQPSRDRAIRGVHY